MNERNVAALRAILVEQLEPGNLSAEEIGDLAEDLATHGVLVPFALTDQECADLFHESEFQTPARAFRPHLEQIAKGEP